jgi:hypothetical protein
VGEKKMVKKVQKKPGGGEEGGGRGVTWGEGGPVTVFPRGGGVTPKDLANIKSQKEEKRKKESVHILYTI